MSRSHFWFDTSSLPAALARAGLSGSSGRRPGRESPRPEPRPLYRPAAEDGPADFAPTTGGLGERLDGLAAWAREGFGIETVIVLDEDGLALLDTGDDPDLPAVAAALVHAAERIGRSLERSTPGRWTTQLGGRRHFHVVQVTTDLGASTLGLVAERSLAPAEVDRLVDALVRACGPGEPAVPTGEVGS